jgi:hypothetical protein
MKNVLIEIRGGNIQMIIASEQINFVIIDHDNADAGDPPVAFAGADRVVPEGEFYQEYTDESDPREMEIRDELKREHI